MHVHAAIEGGRINGNGGEVLALGHQVAEAGGFETKIALGQFIQAVAIAGIPQVIGQQGVHHHPLQRQAMAQQHQTVVLGVLQRLWMAGTGQPGG